MGFGTGYKTSGLRPKIVIKDLDGTTQFTYDSDSGATQDFTLEAWSLNGGINSSWGGFTFLIHDPNLDMVDTTVRKKSKIKPKWTVEVYLKKDSASYNLWFKGNVESTSMISNNNNFNRQRVFAVGIGRTLSEKQTDIRKYQLKLSDGVDLDTTDTTAKTSEIVKDLIEDSDHLSHKGLSALGYSVTNVDDIDIKLPDFQKFNSSIAQAIEELANVSACYYGVSPSGDFFFRRREGDFSGYLITNDVDSVKAENWNVQKIMYLKNFPNTYDDTILDTGYSICHAYPVNRHEIDQENTSSNALINLSSNYHSFYLKPQTDTISKISFYLTKTGTLTEDMIVSIIGSDSSTTPEEVDLRKRIVVRGDKLQKEIGSGKWFEISMDNLRVTPLETLWIKIDKYPDSTNYPSMHYQTGTGSYYDSSNGTSWTSRTGSAKLRQYFAKTIRVIGENTTAKRSFGVREVVMPTNDFPDKETALKALGGYMETKGKSRRTYSQITCSTPETMFDIGKTIRIIDKNNTLDFYSNLIAYDMSSDQTGYANEMNITIEEWSY
jgi:hypothetical protein